MGRRVAWAVLAVALLSPSAVVASTWLDVLERLKELDYPSDSIVYVQKTGSGSTTGYQIWRRPKTAGGATVAWSQDSYEFRSKFPSAGATCTGTSTMSMYTTSPDLSVSTVAVCAGNWFGGAGQSCTSGGTFSCVAAGSRTNMRRNFGCVGQVIGDVENAPASVVVGSPVARFDGVRTCANAGAPIATCRASDTLVAEWNDVQPGSCAVSVIAMINVGQTGVRIVSVSNGCIPDGYVVIGEDSGNHVVRRVVDDPSIAPGAVCSSTAYDNPANGATPPATGWPVASNPYGGVNGPPGTGSGTGGGSGVPGGVGVGPGVGGGGSKGCTGNCGPGGGGAPGGDPPPGGGGGASLTQAETQEAVKLGVKQALDQQRQEDKAECGGESGTDCFPSPGVGDYVTTMPEVQEHSLLDLVRGFLTNNPIIGAITGTRIDATAGDCSISFALWGRTVVMDFCWTQPYLLTVGAMLVGLAGIYAMLIAWRA